MSWGVIGPPQACEAFRQSGTVFFQQIGSISWCRELSHHDGFVQKDSQEPHSIHFQGTLHHLDALALSLPPKDRKDLTAWAWQSYVEWGHELVLYLRGDYNAVIWDERQRQVLALTDPFGAKPLYYSCVDDCFFYSSSLTKLLDILPKQPSVCQQKMIGFLTHDLDHEGQSFYEGVFRLLPGQILRWSPANGMSFRTCHPLEQPSPVFRHNKDSDWIDDFKERFHRSVQTRMKSEAHTECLLSGGLDSSSIVAMAQRNRVDRLKTLSLIFPLYSDSDERSYVHSMVKYGNLDSDTIDTTHLDPLLPMSDWLQQASEPSSFPNFYLHQATYQRAHQHGSKQILDGMDGDIVVSHGVELPWLQFQRGHWLTMWQSLNALGATFGSPTRRLLKQLILKPLMPDLYFRFKESINKSQPTFFKENKPNSSESQHIIIPDPSYRQEHAQNILDPCNGHVMRAQHAIADSHGIHVSYPFFDIDLVHLCLNLPANMICSHGYTRYIMRAAMAKHMPEDVRWRQRKSALGHHFRQKLYHDRWSDIWHELNSLPPALTDIVDVTALCLLWKKCQYQGGQTELNTIWPVISLSLWLKKLPH